MWTDVSRADYTTRWDHVFHLIPRARIISKVHLRICIHGCKFAPTPKVIVLQGVECGTVNIPLHHVNLSADFVTGPVVIGVKPSLPFKGVHLLLGNDLAGDKIVVNPLVTDTPNIGQTDDPIEQEIPDLYPSCAVTRAMAKKAILKN